jgi:hypothetical protein
MSDQFTSELEKQFDIARKSLDYQGRTAPPQPGAGTTAGDGRFDETSRAAGVPKK